MKKYIILIVITCRTALLLAENILKISQYETLPDAQITVQLEAENNDPFVAFQADIPIPEGFEYINNSAALNPERISGHVLSASLLTGNVLRLIGYSPNNVAFTGDNGSLVSFTLQSGKKPGTFPMQINQGMLGDSQSTNILTGTSGGTVTILAPDIELSATNLNFSRVALGTQSEVSLTILNTGNQDLIINSLSFDDQQFSTTETTNITITGGSSRNIPVSFEPLTKGSYTKSLYINSNDPDQPSIKATLEAVAFAVNELHTGNISGASSSDCILEFTVNNIEAFTGIQFDIKLPQAMTYTPNSATLFRKDDHIIAVNALNTDTLRVLAYSPGNKDFTLNDGKIMELGFHLNGTGGYYQIDISNVIISDSQGENILSASYDGSLQITSSDISTSNQLAFGDVSMTSEKELTHAIYNYGEEPLIINQFTFSNAFFSSLQSLPLTILPSEQANIPVLFKKGSKGNANGTMKIYSNDPDENIYNIELSGNAFAPNYLRINPEHFLHGETKTLDVGMDNIDDIVALQFDLSFPSGLTPDLENVTLSERKQDHLIAATLLNSNTLRVIVYSPGQQAITGQEGSVLQIPFCAGYTIDLGSYELVFSNMLMSNRQSENVLYGVTNGIVYIDDINSDLKTQHSNETRVFPNPVINELNIVTESDKMVSVEIVSLTGQVLYAGCFIRSTRINLSDLPPGIYVVKTVEGGKKMVGRVVKN